jgi:hypothetical protein
VSARDRFECLRGIVQPGSIDFEIEQMTALGAKLVGVSFGSGMPDYRSRRTDSFFPPKDFHVGPSQKEGNVRLLMLMQGKPLARRMELLNDPKGTDLLCAESVTERVHFQSVGSQFSFRREYAEFARNVQFRESFMTVESDAR